MGGNLNPDATNGLRASAHHNISHSNKSDGFTQNAGKNITLKNNTVWNNGHRGYQVSNVGGLLQDNIALGNTEGPALYETHDSRINNSWNIGGAVEFISTNPTSANFMKPVEGSPHQGIGAYPSSGNTDSANDESSDTNSDNDNDSNSDTVPLSTNGSLPTTVPIWILGDSTVCDYSEADVMSGYGTYLREMFIDPERVLNRARSGASAKNYKATTTNSSNGVGKFWGDGSTLNASGIKGVKQLMLEADTTQGGYLLIPFGHNDKYVSGAIYSAVRAVPGLGNEWDIELMEYINFARSINVTPILITASSSMGVFSGMEYYRHRTPHLDASTPAPYEHLREGPADWPQTIIDMGAREDILVLDLMEASVNHYKTFPDNQSIRDAYEGTNDVHTNEAGARMLAGLVRDLAKETGPTGFAEQFQ